MQADRLSIVVQGRLDPTDLAQTVRHCRHWRTDYPQAEIILAISSGTLLSIQKATPTNGKAAGTASALAELMQTVDQIVHARPAATLAPLKFGGASNNVNLQIAAAQAGLAAARRPFCLRIRSDLTLAGPLLDHYQASLAAAPPACLLTQRVMICHLFTLNPYTVERLPFHFSDWFQLGATADLRAMWAIPPYASGDADHYRTNPHPRYSNEAERSFQSRLGAEQYIAFSYWKQRRSDLVLDFHNDLVNRRQSVDLLMQEYVIADPDMCRIAFRKYGHVIDHRFSDRLCIGHDDWRRLSGSAGTADYPGFFEAKMARLGPLPHGYD